MNRTRAGGVLVALALLTTLAGPAQAAVTPAVTEATVTASLKGLQLATWKSLSKAQKRATTTILSDPYFGVPSKAAALENKYPSLQVADDTSAAEASALATVSRTTWVRQRWTILGVTYTEVTTTIGYYTYNGRVTGVHRCTNSYVNWLPTRSLNGYSWYTLGNGLADCWTEWQLARPFQSTVTGYQGLRVDGYGRILKIWYV